MAISLLWGRQEMSWSCSQPFCSQPSPLLGPSSGTLLWSSSPGSGSPMGSIGAFEHLHTTLPYLVPLHLQPHSALIQGGAWSSSVFPVPGTGTGMELVLSVFPCVPCPLGWSQDSSLTIRPDSGFRNLAPCLWLGRFRWKTNRESWWGCL